MCEPLAENLEYESCDQHAHYAAGHDFPQCMDGVFDPVTRYKEGHQESQTYDDRIIRHEYDYGPYRERDRRVPGRHTSAQWRAFTGKRLTYNSRSEYEYQRYERYMPRGALYSIHGIAYIERDPPREKDITYYDVDSLWWKKGQKK